MHGSQISYDHLGNKYTSFTEMARTYGKPVNTIRNRLKRGWTLEQALTIDAENFQPKVNSRGNIIYDHTGQQFPSVIAMCKHWGIDKAVYYGRLNLGWSLEDILTKPLDYNGGAEHVFDHEGREFESENDMCLYWGIKRTTYRQRKGRGWSTEKALTTDTAPMLAPEMRIGEETYSNCGMKMRLAYVDGTTLDGQKHKKTSHTYCVEFEDGTQVHNVKHSKFAIGRVGHPTLDISHIRGHLGAMETKYLGGKTKKEIWYECYCPVCGLKDIMTPSMILEHNKSH